MYIKRDREPILERIWIPCCEDLMRIADQGEYTYREVWVMSLFVREDALEDALECVKIFDTNVEDYLISVKAAPAGIIHDLLYCDAYIFYSGKSEE